MNRLPPEQGEPSAVGNGSNARAPRVVVVTDSTAYLPQEMLDKHGIRVVSLYVNWGNDVSERESGLDFDAFYARLRSAEQLPTTSQPSIGDFLAVYEPLLEAGHDVVSVHISGGISGTVESARQAAERLAERDGERRVTVVDSRSAAGGLGLIVLATAVAANAGAGAAEVAERAEEASNNFKMWFAVDTLEYLRRGGRIGAAQAWLGSALKIKPILTLENEIRPIERVRTGARARRRLMDYMEQWRDDGAEAWVVQHTQAPETARALVEEAEQMMGRPPLWTSEIGPVIGVHAGPGVLGIGGVPAHVLEPVSAGVASSAGETA